MRKSRKLIAILATVALLATLLVPMVTPAAAAGGYTALQVPNVGDNAWQQLGTVLVEQPASALANGHSVILNLPSDFKFVDTLPPTITGSVVGTVYRYTINEGSTTRLRIDIPGTYAGDPNDLYTASGPFAVSFLAKNQLQLTIQNYTALGNQNVFYIYLDSVFVKDGYSGAVDLVAEAPAGSGFLSGSVTVANVPGGKVEVSVPEINTFNNDVYVKIRVKELTNGSLEAKSDSLKFILPAGFEWVSVTGGPEAGNYPINVVTSYLLGRTIWGTAPTFGAGTLNSARDELTIAVNNVSTQAAYMEFYARIQVADESKVKAGKVTMKVRGSSTYTPSEIDVAEYGEYGVTVSAESTPNVYAGGVDQAIGNIVIKEVIGESLIDGRYITLTLPGYAKWTRVPSSVSDSGITLKFVSVAGSDGNVIRYNISNPSSGNGAAELKFEDLEVAVDVTAPGDLKVSIGGTTGFTGEVTVAKILKPVTVKAESKPDVKIGVAMQKIGDITITESAAGAIKDSYTPYGSPTSQQGTLVLVVPEGTEFAKLPKVEVVSGDLKIDGTQVRRAKYLSTVDYTNFWKYLVIPIENDSNDASTIKVSDIYLNVNRTVPEGNLMIAVAGSGVLLSNTWTDTDVDNDGANDYTASNGLFPATAGLTAVAAANVVTPAPGEQKAKVVFAINDTKYTVNGVEQTMDVAPYIKDGRTFVPVRYAAQAVGVTPENILYSDGKVTLIKGDKVVQLTIGSNVMLINGIAINMDVAAEISNDRTMLPFRWVAQALGAKVNWDEATQTVTMEL